MQIHQIENTRKKDFMDILLLADEQVNMIEKYLYRGELFALYDDNDLRAVCVVTNEEDENIELKNIATYPEHQRKGYGQQLVAHVLNQYKDKAKTIYVGTKE